MFTAIAQHLSFSNYQSALAVRFLPVSRGVGRVTVDSEMHRVRRSFECSKSALSGRVRHASIHEMPNRQERT
jgi:hypothetical protein